MVTKRPRSSVDMAAVDIWKRELGALTPRSFSRTLGASQDLVLRLKLYKKLEKHRGCVNTVSFNADGDILLSGSDDQRLILWDWATGKSKQVIESGHLDNVFQAKFMPYTDDRSIATCAADGQVRHVEILDGGQVESTLLSSHEGRAHKLAIEPGSPYKFYTCGEDGLVQHFDLRTPLSTNPVLFKCYPQSNNYKPVVLYTISIDPRRPNLFAIAGSNNYARLYDIRRYKDNGSSERGQPIDCFCPPHLTCNKRVGITGLAFSEQRELLVSYNSENIYLFTPDMGLGPNPDPNSCSLTLDSDNDESTLSDNSLTKSIGVDKMTHPQSYAGHINKETVKGVSFCGPNSDYVTSGSDCGSIFIWKKKGGQLMRAIEADKCVVNCITCHPHTMVLASSGIDTDVKIWHPEAAEKDTLHEINRPRKRRPMHFFFDLYDEDEVEDDDDDDDDDGSTDDSEEDDSMNEYDEEEEEDEDDTGSEEDEFNYEAYESCDSGESDHDIAIDDDPAASNSSSDD